MDDSKLHPMERRKAYECGVLQGLDEAIRIIDSRQYKGLMMEGLRKSIGNMESMICKILLSFIDCVKKKKKGERSSHMYADFDADIIEHVIGRLKREEILVKHIGEGETQCEIAEWAIESSEEAFNSIASDIEKLKDVWNTTGRK